METLRRILIALSVVLVVCRAIAADAPCDDPCSKPTAMARSGYPVTLFGTGTKDMMYEFEITGERADKMPRWNPTGGPPPLAISDAVVKAEAWMKKRNPEVRQF